MANITKKLDELIWATESEISSIKIKLLELEARLQGYLLAKSSIDEAETSRRRSNDDGPVRPLSDSWRRVLAHIASLESNGASIDDIVTFVEKNNLQISRGSIRSQLSIYNKRGYVERVAGGRYRLSLAGAAISKPAEGSGDSSSVVEKPGSQRDSTESDKFISDSPTLPSVSVSPSMEASQPVVLIGTEVRSSGSELPRRSEGFSFRTQPLMAKRFTKPLDPKK